MSSYHNVTPSLIYADQEFFTGLIPGSSAMTEDWNLDDDDVTRSRELMNYMADPSRAQPLMAGELDLDVTDEPTPRPDETMDFPHATLSLPPPILTHDFRMSVSLDPSVSIGDTPFGKRKWVSFTGGTWSGSFGSGTVLPGGQDSQVVISDGSVRIDTNYLLQTNDNPPAFIAAKTRGWRTGPPDILKTLENPTQADSVDPRLYKLRLFVELETGDERYRDKINCGMWVGSGMRKDAEVIYDAYRVS